MTGRQPGERCLGCRKRLSAVGGQRIVAAGAVRVTMCVPLVAGMGLRCERSTASSAPTRGSTR
jgi:hypothetical protein